jgi:hypothetical protein
LEVCFLGLEIKNESNNLVVAAMKLWLTINLLLKSAKSGNGIPANSKTVLSAIVNDDFGRLGVKALT